jgi:hypothetical protein
MLTVLGYLIRVTILGSARLENALNTNKSIQTSIMLINPNFENGMMAMLKIIRHLYLQRSLCIQ